MGESVNITSEKIERYREILELEKDEDMEVLIVSYANALSDYFDYDIYNIARLNMIIEAFKCFFGFELEENNYDNLVLKGLDLLERKNKDFYTYSEIIYMIATLISTRLLENADRMSENCLTTICGLLYNLYSTIEVIEVYEMNGNVVKKKSAN